MGDGFREEFASYGATDCESILITSYIYIFFFPSDFTQIAAPFMIQSHVNHCDPGQALLSNAVASMILATVSWQGNCFGTCQGAILGLNGTKEFMFDSS